MSDCTNSSNIHHKKIDIILGLNSRIIESNQSDSTAQSIQMPKPDSISVEVGVDAVALAVMLATLLANVVNAIFAFKNSHDIKNVAPKNITTRIKPQDIEQDKSIEAAMNRIMGVTDASRIAIALFTNGNDAHVFPFKYFSILWEICNNGIAETKANYQKVPLVKIKGELERCFKSDGHFVRYSITEYLPDECKNYLISNKIHTSLSRLIGNEKDGYVGIINIQFDKEAILAESTMQRIDEIFITLESLLEKKTSNKRWFPSF